MDILKTMDILSSVAIYAFNEAVVQYRSAEDFLSQESEFSPCNQRPYIRKQAQASCCRIQAVIRPGVGWPRPGLFTQYTLRMNFPTSYVEVIVPLLSCASTLLANGLL